MDDLNDPLSPSTGVAPTKASKKYTFTADGGVIKPKASRSYTFTADGGVVKPKKASAYTFTADGGVSKPTASSWPPQARPDVVKQTPREAVRADFIEREAANPANLTDLGDIFDVSKRREKAANVARAEGIGEPMYPGAKTLRAGVSKPIEETPESRRVVTRMAAETRAPGAGAGGARIAESLPEFMRGTVSAPANITEWGKENMAVPRKTASGRQMLGQPGWEDQVQLALAAPILAPLGVADELYRQAKTSMRDIQGLPPAETPEEREGFLPQGDVPALNLGRAVARAPSALGEIAVDTGANIGRNIRDEGLVQGLGKSLGLDKDPVRNVLAGEESAAQGESWGESLWRGAKRFPGEAMDLLTLPATMGWAGAKQLGKLGDPTYDPGEVMKEAADVTKDVATGALRSVARTALDPRAEFERGPIGTALNAAMAGGAVRSLASRPLEAIARDTAILNKKLGMVERTIEPLAKQADDVRARAARTEIEAGQADAAVRNMEARIEVAERSGTPIDASAYDELARLRDVRRQKDADVMTSRQEVEAFTGPSAKTEDFAKGWARVVKQIERDKPWIKAEIAQVKLDEQIAAAMREMGVRPTEGWTPSKLSPDAVRYQKARDALIEATAKLEAAGVPQRTLDKALKQRAEFEARLANKKRLGNVIEAAARAPSWYATLGTSAGVDAAGYVARRLMDRFPELRWWLNPRNEQVGPVVAAIERERGATQTMASQKAVEMIRSIPDEAKPTVRQFLQSELSPLEGGYFAPGNDTSRHMFRFRMGKQPQTPRDKWRQQQVIAQGKMPEWQTRFERTEYGEMVRESKLDEAAALRQRAREIEEGAPIVDDLDGAALDLKRSEVQSRLDDVNAQIEELVGVRAERGAAAVSKAEDATIRAQGADFELGAARAREADLSRGIGARADNRPLGADEMQAETARISALSAQLRAAREAAAKQARAEVKAGLSAQTEAAIGGAIDARKATIGAARGVWADALELARQEAQAAIEATPRGGKGKTREAWNKAISAERRAEELRQARAQGAEDLRTQLAIKAARAAESRAWAAWQDSLTKSEQAQAAADAARLRGEVADLKTVADAKAAAAKAWNDARRATYRAEVTARSRMEDLSRIEQAAEAAVRRETGLGPSDPMRMGAVVPPLGKGAQGPTIPRSQRAGPVLARDAARSREAVVGLQEESALLSARLQELDSLAELRRQGRVLPTEAERAAIAKDLRDQSIKADDYVARMDNEQEIVNRYGRGLAGLSRQYTERAKALKMFENAEQVRDLYWPQLYDEAARGGVVADPMGGMSSAEKAKLAPYLKAGAFKANELRRAGVPITRREAEYGLKTDLAEEALVGLMSFIDDVEMYTLYDDAAKVPGLTRTPQQFEQMKSAAVAEHNARVAQQFRGNPRLIAENAIDPVTMKGAENLPVMREWVLVPDEARFPEQVRATLAKGGKADEGLLKYGALGGKYVPADLYFDMVNRRAAMEQMASGIARVNSMWKAGKTVWSPATHARNILSSALVFAPMAGMSFWNPMNLPHYAAALQDLTAAKKSRLYQLAEQDGVFKGGFGANELGRNYLGAKLQGAFESVTEPGKRFVEMLGDTASFTAKRGKEARSGAVQAEREMAQKLRDVTDNEQWLRLRKSSPELASTAAGKAAVESGKAAVSSAMDLPGMIYAAEDDLFRYAYYRKNLDKIARERGTSPELLDAGTRRRVATEAREAFIDYENVPGFAHVLKAPFAPVGREGKARRGFEAVYWTAGQPFISFMTRAIPRVKKWLTEDPIRAQMWLQASDRLTDMNAALSGVTRDEGEAAKAAYPFASPTSLKPVGQIIPELARDEQGRVNLANVGYLSPFSSLTESKTNKYDTETAQAMSFISELLGIGPNMLVGPLYEQAANRSTFTGQPIVREGSTPMQEFGQRASQLIQSYAPPIFPSMSDVTAGQVGTDTQDLERIKGGSQYEQIAAAVQGVPDYRGRERTVPGAFGAIASGTKVLGVTLDDALEAEARMVEEARREIARTSQAATGIQVPRTSMNRQEEREFATDYRRRLTPVLKTFREATAKFPASPVVNRIRRGFRRLDGAKSDVIWMERADELLDEALSNAAEKAAEAKRIRTDAMRQGAIK